MTTLGDRERRPQSRLSLKCSEQFSNGWGDMVTGCTNGLVDLIPGSILYTLWQQKDSPPRERKERFTLWTYGCAAAHIATGIYLLH